MLQRKFNWTEAECAYSREQILSVANLVEPHERVDVVLDDTDDNRIVECAAAARSDYLVTGDRHLLKLGSYRGTQIVNVADFLALGRMR